jgi:hypothetical protein
MQLKCKCLWGLCFLLMWASPQFAQPVLHSNFFYTWPVETLETLKNTPAILKRADYWMTQPTVSVTQKSQMFESEDRRDYCSLAPYYWKNDTGQNLEIYLYKEGKLNPEADNPETYDFNRFKTMETAVTELSLAYYLTQNEHYAKKAVSFIYTWFIDPQTKMNPHMRYAHRKPGGVPGSFSGVIESKGLIRVLDALYMLENSEELTPEYKAKLEGWFTEFYEWMDSRREGTSLVKSKSHIGTWYDVQVASIGMYLNRPKEVVKIIDRAKDLRVALQIDPDGSQPFEQAWTDSLSGYTSNLSAFIILCRIGDQVGVDLWGYETEEGRSIRKALAYIVPYIDGKKTWGFRQSTAHSFKPFAPYLNWAAQRYQIKEWEKTAKALENAK